MALPLDDLSLLDGPAGDTASFAGPASAGGAPLQIPLDLIDEDPGQPRTEFDADALRELAETIALRGVRQPVSVRPHPREPGRWMLNFGARRFRASRLAGKDTIPAFVDATADSFDQVIENEQRQRLSPLELALFVQKQQAAGVTLAEIARRLGKTRGYLTFVSALIDAPTWLLGLYRSGACTGMTELYDLRKLHERDAARVDAWLRDGADFTRAGIAGLKARLAAGPAGLADGEVPEDPRRAAAGAQSGAQSRIARRTITTTAKTTRHVAGLSEPEVAGSATGKPPPEPVASVRVRWQSRLLRIPLETRRDESGQVVINAVDETGEAVAVPGSEFATLPVLGLDFVSPAA